ncbi:MAG TPA: hypothetical protein VGJ60_07075 [Chloroflexota bacterium]|jgi:hypothetical protein
MDTTSILSNMSASERSAAARLLAALLDDSAPAAPAAPAESIWTADKIVRWVDRGGSARNAAGATITDGASDPDGLLAVAAKFPGRPVFTAAYPKSASARAKYPDAVLAGTTPAPKAPVAPPAPAAPAPTLRGRLLETLGYAAEPAPAPAPKADPLEELLADVARVRALPGADVVLRALRMVHDKHAANRGNFTHADVDVALGLREPATTSARTK